MNAKAKSQPRISRINADKPLKGKFAGIGEIAGHSGHGRMAVAAVT